MKNKNHFKNAIFPLRKGKGHTPQ